MPVTVFSVFIPIRISQARSGLLALQRRQFDLWGHRDDAGPFANGPIAPPRRRIAHFQACRGDPVAIRSIDALLGQRRAICSAVVKPASVTLTVPWIVVVAQHLVRILLEHANRTRAFPILEMYAAAREDLLNCRDKLIRQLVEFLLGGATERGGCRCTDSVRAASLLRADMILERTGSRTDNIVDHCCYAWNTLLAQPWKIMSIARRDWAMISQTL